MLRKFYEMAREKPKRVVFSESNHINMLKAAEAAYAEGICFPILLGNEEKIERLAQENEIDLKGIEIINLRHDREEKRRVRFAQNLAEKKVREGMTYEEAYEKMYERNYFGMMMVELDEADALITGVYTKYADSIQAAKDVVGVRDGLNYIGAMHILNTKKGTFFLADTLYNRHPSTEALIDIAKLTHESVKFFAHKPVMAMLSYSNFGSDKVGSPASVHQVVKTLHEKYPEMIVDGEMQVTFALNKELRDAKFPFSKLKGHDVNTLIFPNLSSANTAYKMLIEMGLAESIGPIQMGLKKPIHILDVESSVRDIVNMTAVAVLDAIVAEQIRNNNLQKID
jgi:malate dehydrogenase (oxaloacetate-decarboxylating)(NADP+)